MVRGVSDGRGRRRRGKGVGYALTRRDPDDLRVAVAELNRLGVDSAHIYLDDPETPGMAGFAAALHALEDGDRLVVSNLTRLARSVADLAELIDHLDELGVGLVVGEEPVSNMPARRLVRLLAAFQVALVRQAVDDAEWVHRGRADLRRAHARVDAVQGVWLQQLYDAGMPRLQLGEHFGVSRATVFRVVADTPHSSAAPDLSTTEE